MENINTSLDGYISLEIIWGGMPKLNTPNFRVNKFVRHFIHSLIFHSLIHLTDSYNWQSTFYGPSALLGDGNLEGSTSPFGSRTLSWWSYPKWGKRHGTGKRHSPNLLCYFTVLPKAGTGSAHRCPTSTTTGEACKKLPWKREVDFGSAGFPRVQDFIGWEQVFLSI